MSRLSLTFRLALFALLSACAATDTAVVETTAIEVIKSPNDAREYRYLRLENQLQVLLVSDPESDKSAAALTVFRGSMHEPDEHPGLAHFLEHMLFIGTEKYPEVDGYQDFVSAAGGSSNAYTANDHTNYFFDVGPQAFPEALDRFAQFFISPLFSAEYVEREKNAVHSEYQLQIKDDAWRGNAVSKVAMNPEHPAARFNIGSLETLGDGVREALLEFFDSNYSADQMSLVALDTRPLDDIEALVRERFAAIENRNIGDAAALGPVYTRPQLPARLDFQPIKDERAITYRFPTESTQPYYRSKPDIYLTNLLGHEGKGSLLQALKARGWVNALYASSGDLDEDESAIEISMTLTEEGAAHIDQISGYLFAYIDLLRGEAPAQWRFDEQASVADLGFRYLEKQSATATVYQLAPGMMRLPPQDLLRARFLMDDFSADTIRRFAGYLSPDNVLLSVQLPDAPADESERWFGVPYTLTSGNIHITPPPTEALAELRLPDANPYLPENLNLYPASANPQEVIATPTVSIWQHADTSFGAPKATLRFNLNLADGLVTPADIAAARLYQRLVADALNEFAYPTYLAGMSYSVAALPAGFRIEVSGYNDKQLALLDRVLATFAKMKVEPDRFDIIKTELLTDLQNADTERPFNQAYDALGDALLTSSWPPQAIAAALQNISAADLVTWRAERLSAARLFGLAHGNLPAEQAKVLKDLVAKHITLKPIEPRYGDVEEIDRAARIRVPVEHDDAAFVAYIQDKDESWESRAESALAVQLLRQAYFTSLRTEQQLGYVVAMANRTTRRRGGIAFIVQSPVAGAGQLLDVTKSFLDEQAQSIGDLSEEAFEASREGLLVRLREEDENLRDRTSRYWADLIEGITTLDSRERIAQAVEALTLQHMARYVRALPGRLSEQSLVVYSPGQFPPISQHGTAYGSVEAFKTR